MTTTTTTTTKDAELGFMEKAVARYLYLATAVAALHILFCQSKLAEKYIERVTNEQYLLLDHAEVDVQWVGDFASFGN